jgi:hypothetical protein
MAADRRFDEWRPFFRRFEDCILGHRGRPRGTSGSKDQLVLTTGFLLPWFLFN